MRTGSVLIALFLVMTLTPVFPGAVAQGRVVDIASDASGDVEVRSGDTVQTLPADLAKAADLVSLDVIEERQDIIFILGLQDVDPDTGDLSVFAQETVRFRHQDVTYVVAFTDFYSLGNTFHSAALRVFDPGTGRMNTIINLDVTVDDSANTLQVSAPRSLLVDSNGAAPFPGRSLEGFHVLSEVNHIGGTRGTQALNSEPPYFTDRMPNEGESDTVLPIELGIKQTGHARLDSAEPYRFSNGEATTFVYTVQATNTGAEADSFVFEVASGPSNWEYDMPVWSLAVPAGETLSLPILVRTPFGHNHGSVDTFVLEMRSLSDPGTVGRIEMGVNYPAIPQPAGHHDTLWFHSVDTADSQEAQATALVADYANGAGGAFKDLYMNAVQEHDVAEEVPVEGRFCNNSVSADGPRFNYCWIIDLTPGLLMGLDFDMEREGTIEFRLDNVLPMLQMRVQGWLQHAAPDREIDLNNTESSFGSRQWVDLATIGPTEDQDVDPQQTTAFSIPVVPTDEADLVPYSRGASLRLVLEMSAVRVDTPKLFGPRDEPVLQPGGWMQLPLFEYSDPVNEVFSFNSRIHLQPKGPQDRMVNPGESVLFQFDVHNMDSAADRIDLELLGTHVEWAAIVGSDTRRIEGGGGETINIMVSPPLDAEDGVLVDLVLQATSRSDANARGLARFVATVDLDKDYPDEKDILSQETVSKESPGFAVPAVGLALAALALRRKRLA